MDKPEKLATMVAWDTGRRQRKQKTQHRKKKKKEKKNEQHRFHQKPGVNPGVGEGFLLLIRHTSCNSYIYVYSEVW